jgi:hypothetical protein
MEGDVDRIGAAFDTFGKFVEGAFQKIGGESEQQIIEMVSIPVGRAGNRIVRSKPHEAPRTETGKYRGSFANAVERNAGDVVLVLYSNDPKGVFLQIGTSRMIQRNHFDRIINYWEATFESRLAQHIQQSSSTN